MIHESHESCDHIHESQRACERRAPDAPDPPELGEPDSLDTWAWCDAPIGADDLAVLDSPTQSTAGATIVSQPRVMRCGPWFYIADGVRCGTTHRTEAEARAAWDSLVNPTLPKRAASADHARSQIEPSSGQSKQSAVIMPDLEVDDRASYDKSLDWTAQNGPPPARSWRAELSPRELERWNRRPDLGGAWEVREPTDGVQAEQQHLDAGDAPETTRSTMPFLLPRRKKPARHQARSPKARERYMDTLATRTEVELADELRKHRNTLKKYAGAVWVDQIRDKLVLVEAEIDRRATGPPTRTPAMASFDRVANRGAPLTSSESL